MKLLQVRLLIVLLFITLQPLFAQEMTPEATAEPERASPQPTATLGGVPMKIITGKVSYQNRLPDHTGIHIQILDNDLNLLGTTVTNAQGIYTVTAPIDAFYWLVAAAPLHLRQTLPMPPGSTVPELELIGGDLNQDDCIGPSDVGLLVSQLDLVGAVASDITGDGVTDVADLAIVTGNYDPNCEALPVIEATEEATAEITPEATVEVTAESTAEATAEITPEVTAESTVEATVEATAESTAEATVEVTAEATAESTVEATAEATAEVTPEITVEITPEVTAEVTEEPVIESNTPEVTAEVTVEVTAAPPATLTLEITPIPTQTPSPTVTFTPIPTVTEETTVEASAGD